VSKDSEKTAETKAAALGIGKYAQHIFLCTGDSCCDAETGQEVWQHLKSRLKELDIPVFRTKAGCLRICCDGPIAVVYPDGTWYKNVTLENIDKIIDSHLVKGVPVKELAFAKNPLPAK
jgi:(2Fe-2S) ferredoxin